MTGLSGDGLWIMRNTALLTSLLLAGCGSTTQIRIGNVSDRDFTNVSVAGEDYGDIPPGAVTPYRPVTLTARYASMKLRVDQRYTTAQALHFGGKRYTYRIAVRDWEKGHLAIDLVPDQGEEK